MAVMVAHGAEGMTHLKFASICALFASLFS